MLEIALNPAALEENNKGDEEVCILALNFARQQYGLRLSEKYTVVSCSPKSGQSDLQQRLSYQQWPNAPRQPATGRAGSPVWLWAAKSTYNEPFSSFAADVFSFTFLTQLLLMRAVHFYSQPDPGHPAAADLLSAIREPRWEHGGSNDLQAHREQK